MAPESGRQCAARGDAPRVTYPCKKEDEPPEVTRVRLASRLKWRQHLVTLSRLEAFVCRFPVLGSLTDMRVLAQTMKLIEGIGFANGTPQTLSDVAFSRQRESTPLRSRYEFENFVERSSGTGEQIVLKRLRFDLSIDYYALWKLALQFDVDLKAKGIPSSSGWWGHAVRLMLRYQWWVFFGTDNWTQRTEKNEHLHKQFELLPETEEFQKMLYFGSTDHPSARFDKLERSIGTALKHQGLLPRSRPSDLSRLVESEGEWQRRASCLGLTRDTEREAVRERQRQEKEQEALAEEERERERKREQKRQTRMRCVSTKNVSEKRKKDEQTEQQEIQKHNTVYLFKVTPTITKNAQDSVRHAAKTGWLKKFSNRTSGKMGVTSKKEPTERERCLNDKFGVTHVLDQYVHLRDDVKKEDVEKLLFENVKARGANNLEALDPSTEHFFFDHDVEEGFEDEEAMDLFRTVFFDTVRPYLDLNGEEQRLSADMESDVYESA